MVSRHYDWEHASDGTSTMDGATDSLPLSTNFTSNPARIGEFAEVGIHLKCSNVTTPIVTEYLISIDGSEWMSGAVTINDLDNNEQYISITEKGVHFIKVNVNNTNTAAATVLVAIGMKS